jgi:hypothetical protein
VPYYESFLEKQPDFGVIEAVTKTAIRTTPKVLEILSFELDFDPLTRNLFINFSVSTEDGVINSNLVLP